MKFESSDSSSVTLKFDLLEFRDLQSLLIYAANQYSHFDDAILDVPEIRISSLNRELELMSDTIESKRSPA